tara:strand:- start:1302 stop:1523 length:222 start_codon:yes stop_codon:yes gene_type:complete
VQTLALASSAQISLQGDGGRLVINIKNNNPFIFSQMFSAQTRLRFCQTRSGPNYFNLISILKSAKDGQKSIRD